MTKSGGSGVQTLFFSLTDSLHHDLLIMMGLKTRLDCHRWIDLGCSRVFSGGRNLFKAFEQRKSFKVIV